MWHCQRGPQAKDTQTEEARLPLSHATSLRRAWESPTATSSVPFAGV